MTTSTATTRQAVKLVPHFLDKSYASAQSYDRDQVVAWEVFKSYVSQPQPSAVVSYDDWVLPIQGELLLQAAHGVWRAKGPICMQ